MLLLRLLHLPVLHYTCVDTGMWQWLQNLGRYLACCTVILCTTIATLFHEISLSWQRIPDVFPASRCCQIPVAFSHSVIWYTLHSPLTLLLLLLNLLSAADMCKEGEWSLIRTYRRESPHHILYFAVLKVMCRHIKVLQFARIVENSVHHCT